jgi:hypothetical protein
MGADRSLRCSWRKNCHRGDPVNVHPIGFLPVDEGSANSLTALVGPGGYFQLLCVNRILFVHRGLNHRLL